MIKEISNAEIEYSTGSVVLYLIGVIGFLIYKIIQEVTLDNLIILLGCVLGVIATYRIQHHIKRAKQDETIFIISHIERNILDFTVFIVLGGVGLYITLVKGVYGLYELFEGFSWFLLFFRLLVLFIGIKLVGAVDRIQGGFQLVKSLNSQNRKSNN